MHPAGAETGSEPDVVMLSLICHNRHDGIKNTFFILTHAGYLLD